jgi:hypothetical protein
MFYNIKTTSLCSGLEQAETLAVVLNPASGLEKAESRRQKAEGRRQKAEGSSQ